MFELGQLHCQDTEDEPYQQVDVTCIALDCVRFGRKRADYGQSLRNRLRPDSFGQRRRTMTGTDNVECTNPVDFFSATEFVPTPKALPQFCSAVSLTSRMLDSQLEAVNYSHAYESPHWKLTCGELPYALLPAFEASSPRHEW